MGYYFSKRVHLSIYKIKRDDYDRLKRAEIYDAEIISLKIFSFFLKFSSFFQILRRFFWGDFFIVHEMSIRLALFQYKNIAFAWRMWNGDSWVDAVFIRVSSVGP